MRCDIREAKTKTAKDAEFRLGSADWNCQLCLVSISYRTACDEIACRIIWS